MIKVIFQDSQEELVKASGAMTTLIETESHIKSAASDAVTDKLLRENRPDDRHFAVHLIAMGSQEKYGFNRNGDGWPEDGLTRRHHTFVSHGHLFREHKNSGKEHAIGSAVEVASMILRIDDVIAAAKPPPPPKGGPPPD